MCTVEGAPTTLQFSYSDMIYKPHGPDVATWLGEDTSGCVLLAEGCSGAIDEEYADYISVMKIGPVCPAPDPDPTPDPGPDPDPDGGGGDDTDGGDTDIVARRLEGGDDDGGDCDLPEPK